MMHNAVTKIADTNDAGFRVTEHKFFERFRAIRLLSEFSEKKAKLQPPVFLKSQDSGVAGLVFLRELVCFLQVFKRAKLFPEAPIRFHSKNSERSRRALRKSRPFASTPVVVEIVVSI